MTDGRGSDNRTSKRGGARVGARIPPHNLAAEESLLGALLLSRDAMTGVAEMGLRSTDFYKLGHQHVYEAIRVLMAAGEPIDPVTVAEELRRGGLADLVGGPNVLMELAAATPAISSATRYARIVQDTALLRRLIATAGEIAELAYDEPDDVAKALDEAESKVFEIAEHRVTDSTKQITELLGEVVDDIERIQEQGHALTGLPTGYTDLDELLSGLQPSTLNIIGARPSMGKTAFALGIASHAAIESGRAVLFFSLEMGHKELTQRVLSSEARVDSSKLRKGQLSAQDWSKIGRAVGRLEAPLFIDDNPNVTVMEIRAKARRMQSRQQDLGLIIIDYLQLMSGRGSAENRQVEVSEISRGLKILARELAIPVVALSQLSRNLESRADKRPMLADLRESGCVPATTRIMRADTGTETTIGALVLSQEQPMVWSIDDEQKVVPARLVKAFPTGIKPVFRVTLASGRSVEATANHPFLTVDGWERLDALEVGGFVATPRRLPTPTAATGTLSDDEIVLMAHLLGDGHAGNSFKYTTADPANKEVVEQAARRLFGIEARPDGKKRGKVWQLWFPSPYRLGHGVHHPMRNWLEPHGLSGKRAWDKFVPQAVFTLPDDKIALFLRHLWSTDGSITVGRNARGRTVATYYSTTSRQLALDVQRLLLRFGIRTSIGSGKKERADGGTYRPGYNVRVQGARNQERFLTGIGCHGRRGALVDEALDVLAPIKENPNVDLVPWEISRRVKSALAVSGVTHRELAAALGERYAGSCVLGSEDRPRRFSRDRLRRIGEITGAGELVRYAVSDIHWDEVVSIEAIGELPTFDATIEGTHNFLADGIVVHNSLEQDADVVMFLYRDEVYNPESADRGAAEIIVAKHRSGPIGTRRVAFLGQYTRFDNMARP